jgi:hypothetical protein
MLQCAISNWDMNGKTGLLQSAAGDQDVTMLRWTLNTRAGERQAGRWDGMEARERVLEIGGQEMNNSL